MYINYVNTNVEPNPQIIMLILNEVHLTKYDYKEKFDSK